MVKKIITEDCRKYEPSILKEICEPCKSVEEGEEIGVQLLKELSESNSGIGLAANQVGINKRVAVLNVKEPIVLINPTVVETNDIFFFVKEC